MPPSKEEDPALAATLAPATSEDLAFGHTLLPTADAVPGRSDFPVANWARDEFLARLGQGGMGTVYKARAKLLGRIVALKFIRGTNSDMVMRFLQEARAQARLDHRHICKVYEVGKIQGQAYIAMQ